MDAQWIYGETPENIYSTITEGRPNGMPSFRQKIPDSQVWQLVAYVRSMSGQLRKDVEPTRNDDMNARRSEQRTERKTPQRTTPGRRPTESVRSIPIVLRCDLSCGGIQNALNPAVHRRRSQPSLVADVLGVHRRLCARDDGARNRDQKRPRNRDLNPVLNPPSQTLKRKRATRCSAR